MYCIAMKKHIIDNTSFKMCLQLLKFLSKDDLLKKYYQVSSFININIIIYFIYFIESLIIFICIFYVDKQYFKEYKE